MRNSKKSNYFIGLDIGTNSVGYAVSHEDYTLVKHQQHPMWGVHLFESANSSQERRSHRAARRRLDRRKQRIVLLRELFSRAVAAVDPCFFQRINNSSLKKNSDELPYAIFADREYTDSDFYKQYPTIHHLISELIDSDRIHDVRLVYIACAWLLVHRGHFFSDVDKEKVDEITNFSSVYRELEDFLEDHDYILSWRHAEISSEKIGDILKSSLTVTAKHKKLTEYLQVKKNKQKGLSEETAWFDESEFLKLLCGGKAKTEKLFPGSDSSESELVLDADDEKIAEMLSALNEDDASLLLLMKKIFDWSVLADIIGDGRNISTAKVQVYEKHKSDLKQLKYIVKKYLSRSDYTEIFRSSGKNNYAAYCGKEKKITREDFYKFILAKLKNISTEDPTDQAAIAKIQQEIATEKFLPKQVTSDNRTIPYQLYWNELSNLLKKASSYLPFLLERDEDGISVQEKILSIMEFRIPYFVGPLNAHSRFAWVHRRSGGKILPWNFDKKIDLDASEEAFIRHMTNTCTYLPGEAVLPKCSLLYQRFEVLNFLNTIQISGVPISVKCKQQLFGLFGKYSKVTKKTICSFLKANNLYPGIDINDITGIDDVITASLSSLKIFQTYLAEKKLTEDEVEQIISQRSFMEDSRRFRLYLKKFPLLTEEDIRKLSTKKFPGFGRLSRKFLTELHYSDPNTGNTLSIISLMWDHNLNLQQLLSDKYPFCKMVEKAKKEYYAAHPSTLAERLDRMYVSNAVKRPISRSLTIVDEITKTMGYPPAKIFVEMARDVTDSKKGKRTVSRLAQLKELYTQIADEDIRRLSSELERYDDAALQKDTLYLYFMQLGRDMYSGEPITDLSLCNKEHIYPQSKVKDDSILNNIVLVNSKVNGVKSDTYPVDAKIRQKMTPFWDQLQKKGLITHEKYSRLTRSTPFSEDEKWGFINRQLVETRQSTKVITELLKERYGNTQIIYVKAGLVSDFRHEFDLVKSRTINDLHHGKDAYLNIVVGNVYHGYFTRNWFMDQSDNYSIKTETLFSCPRKDLTGKLLWTGNDGMGLIKNVMRRNYLHLTCFSYSQKGQLFDQNPLSAGKDLIPLKKNKPTEIYGGYRRPTASFFILSLITEKNKKKTVKELLLLPVDLMIADKFLQDESFRISYVKNFFDPSGKKELSIYFPLGVKPIKIKTVFEVDNGLRFRLNGKANNGKIVGLSLFSPLLLDNDWEKYIKHLESFTEKKKKNPQLIYSEKYDRFSSQKNIQLYDILLHKLQNGIFAVRPSNPKEALEEVKEKFADLSAEKQAEILLGLIASFGTNSGYGVDLTALDGKGKTGVTTLSSNLSNWKKLYTTACIVYTDSSGLHETRSCNLLDLI